MTTLSMHYYTPFIRIPDNWFVDLFDWKYLLVDCMRKTRDATIAEVKGIIQLAGAAPPGPVLDIACGYGRHCLAFAQHGFLVHGVDLSGEILDWARKQMGPNRHVIRFERADVRTWKYPEKRFRLAVCLDTSFGYFSHHEDNLALLQGAYRALAPGGHFVLEQVNFASERTRWRLDEHLHLPGSLKYRKRSRLLARGALWIGTYEYRESGLVVRHPFRIRLYSAEELLRLLQSAGFLKRNIRICGSWAGEPFNPRCSPAMIVIARKP